MNFEYTDAHNGDFVLLCHELDDFLNRLVGGEENCSASWSFVKKILTIVGLTFVFKIIQYNTIYFRNRQS